VSSPTGSEATTIAAASPSMRPSRGPSDSVREDDAEHRQRIRADRRGPSSETRLLEVYSWIIDGVDDGKTPLLIPTDAWRRAFRGAVVGALVMRDVRNPELDSVLEAEKRRLEERLRDAGGASTPRVDRIAQAYVDYYRARNKTYPVKTQRESVAHKGKRIPSQAALVEAMFMAELENLILTAGHDLDSIVPPTRVDVTSDGDRYLLLNGSEVVLEWGDMMMADGAGIVSSVLRGPDLRTRITPQTRNVMFAAYAPAGVGEGAVRDHLERIRANVQLVSPEARTEELTTETAG
jgi:DNA/RNA-binding domain of Phe-tRNA-synthetase-like protein